MRLLLDQNLSFKLCRLLSDLFPGSAHVGALGLAQADDRSVWDHAKANGFVLVSHDADCAEWVRTGNQPTDRDRGAAAPSCRSDHRVRRGSEAACQEIY